MSKAYENVKAYRIRIRSKMLKCFGGRCGICGYDRCSSALEFHHIDPTQKEFNIKADIVRFDELKSELRKCVCVCSNCHKEIHNMGLKIPENILRFNEEIANVELVVPKKEYDKCPICGKTKYIKRLTCSIKCDGVRKRKILNQSDLHNMILVQKLPLTKIAKIVGMTDNGLRKRLKEFGLPIKLKDRKQYAAVA